MRSVFIALSPIHIGNGEQISNWSYSVDKGKIKIYNFDRVVKALGDKQRYSLAQTIERYASTKTLGEVMRDYGLNIECEYELESKSSIKNSNGEYKAIFEFIKENGKVYIPGTEIKGAIRTALFYKILKDRFQQDDKIKSDFLNRYKSCLNIQNADKKSIRRCFSRLEEIWESIVFRDGFENIQEDYRPADIKKDFLRFLMVSDSSLQNPEDCLFVQDVKALGVSRSFLEPYELLKAGAKFELDLKIVINEQYKSLFPSTYRYLSLDNIIKACKEFAIDILKADIEYVESTKELDIQEKQKILNRLRDRINNIEKYNVIPLRIGKHQGFLSTTINLLVKSLDKNLYSRAYEYLVHRGYSDFPNKSRKLTADYEFMGWCILNPLIK